MDFLLQSHRVGRIFGIEVKLAYSLYMVMFIMFLVVRQTHGDLVAATILALPLFVLLHELGHSVTAMHFRVEVRRIVLHMLGGVAELRGMIPGPRAEIVIAVAGPAVSFSLALFFYVLVLLFQDNARGVFTIFAVQNLMLALFNLLPVFPLDGGRVALAGAIIYKGPEKGLKLAKPLSVCGAVLFSAIGVFQMISGYPTGFILLGIGIMLLVQGNRELDARMHAARYMDMQDGWLRSGHSGYGQDEAWRQSLETPWEEMEKKEPGFFQRWRDERNRKKEEKMRENREKLDRRVDEVLKKVNESGLASLTAEERGILHQASSKYSQDK